VVPTPVRIGDAGVVIAAARLSRKANQQAAKYVPQPPRTHALAVPASGGLDSAGLRPNLRWHRHDHGAGGRKASWMANGEEDEDDHDLGEEHFSYFAFDGRTVPLLSTACVSCVVCVWCVCVVLWMSELLC
jgi:hypothetical protein